MFGRLTGPDLKDVSKRQKDREWLINFMMDPRPVIDSGDPYARKILEESRNVPMPKLPGLPRQPAGAAALRFTLVIARGVVRHCGAKEKRGGGAVQLCSRDL